MFEDLRSTQAGGLRLRSCFGPCPPWACTSPQGPSSFSPSTRLLLESPSFPESHSSFFSGAQTCYRILLPVISCPAQPQVCTPPAAFTHHVACCCLPGLWLRCCPNSATLPAWAPGQASRNQSLRSPHSSEHCRWLLPPSFNTREEIRNWAGSSQPHIAVLGRVEAQASKVATKFPTVFDCGLFLIGHSPGCCRSLISRVCSCFYVCIFGVSMGVAQAWSFLVGHLHSLPFD